MRCSRAGCPKNASFIPEVWFWAIGWRRGDHEPMRVMFDLPTCEDCRLSLGPAELLSPECVSIARKVCLDAHTCEPDVTTAEVHWQSLGVRRRIFKTPKP